MSFELVQSTAQRLTVVVIVLSAGCAIIGVFSPMGLAGPWLGTGAVGGVGAGAGFVCIRATMKRRLRPAALLSLGIFYLVVALGVLGIWSETLNWRGAMDESHLLAPIGVLLPALPVLGTGARLIRSTQWVRSGFILLIGGGAWVASLIVFIWADMPGQTGAAIYLPWAAALLILALLQGRTRMPAVIRHICSAMTIAGGIAWAMLLSTMGGGSAPQVQTLLILIAMGLPTILGLTNTFIDVQLERMRWAKPSLIGLISLLVCLTSALIFAEVTNLWRDTDTLLRVATGSLVVTFGFSILMAVASRQGAGLIELPHDAIMQLTCPRCRHELYVGQGDHNCPGCRLQIRLAFESPDCRHCGQVLAPNWPDRCPECGTMVRVDLKTTQPQSV
ncbi:MAG: hypothetical protein MK101_02635 [Phycisphaerales bacterium]|nr:hypothetical protein [Phycisphaerales bacterium]